MMMREISRKMSDDLRIKVSQPLKQLGKMEEEIIKLRKENDSLKEIIEIPQDAPLTSVEQAVRIEEIQGKNRRYREAMITTVDELENIIYQNKNEDVLKHYAKNCKRFLVDALEGESE